MTRSTTKRLYRTVPSIVLPFLFLTPAELLASQFKITRLYDGDSVEAEGHDFEINVRLVGIDAPEASREKHEPGQPFSQQAIKHFFTPENGFHTSYD
jgi:endonuclease YncB( thermonuclease family)